jgi:hypothetical protein
MASLSTEGHQQKILDLEFMEMSEVTMDSPIDQVPGRPVIKDISQWVERYSLMVAVIATRFPDKPPPPSCSPIRQL